MILGSQEEDVVEPQSIRLTYSLGYVHIREHALREEAAQSRREASASMAALKDEIRSLQRITAAARVEADFATQISQNLRSLGSDS